MTSMSWRQEEAAGLHVRPTDLVGYVYREDLYCLGCIVGVLPTGPGGDFDGWALAPGVRMTTGANLDEIAAAFGIDRNDETSFDSGEFPKCLFRSDCGPDDRCGSCGEVIA